MQLCVIPTVDGYNTCKVLDTEFVVWFLVVLVVVVGNIPQLETATDLLYLLKLTQCETIICCYKLLTKYTEEKKF